MLKKMLVAVGITALAVTVIGATAAFAGNGPRNGNRAYGDSGLIAVAAEELNMDRADLLDELLDGKTIADVAEAHGVDVDNIVDAFVDLRVERLDRAVDLGRLTEAEAAERLDLIEARIAEHMTAEWPFAPARDGFMARDGSCGYGAGNIGRHGMMIHR